MKKDWIYMKKVKIISPAHLHAGNMDFNGGLGRLYGTVGVTIEEPNLGIEVEKGKGVTSNDDDAIRFAKILVKRFKLPGIHVEVKRRIPPYVGLGYHTTLALSIGRGISELYNRNLGMEEIALTVKRGLLTAMGLYACKFGGFIVEGGFRVGELDKMVPPLISRYDIPKDWTFVVAIPDEPKRKLADLRRHEDAILERVRMSDGDSAFLSRIVLLGLIPAIAENNLKDFGDALTTFNERLGSSWGRYQSGNYCCDIVDEGIKIMKKEAFSACQTSWGPAFYGILNRKEKAKSLAKKLKEFLDENEGGEVFCTCGRNRGMEVITHG